MIATTEHLFDQQRHESRRQSEMAQRNFNDYARSEDLRLETMLKGEPRETQRARSRPRSSPPPGTVVSKSLNSSACSAANP